MPPTPRPHRYEQQDIPTDRIEEIAGSAAREAVENDVPRWARELIGKVDQVLERLAKGDTALALLEHRLSFIEKIVYGLCGFILLSVLGGIVALVVRSHP